MLLYPRQRYGCIQCGRSCGDWRIWVEPKVQNSLREHPLALRLEVENKAYLSEDGGWQRLAFDPQGRCWFLQSDRLCGLHASTGWESKPRACRQFPFFILDTPDGFQVGLSFRCSAVQQDLGRDWSEHESDLQSLLSDGHYPQVGYQPIAFGTLSLDWTRYRAWEGRWREGLSQSASLSATCWPELRASLDLDLSFEDFEQLLNGFTAGWMAALEGQEPAVTARLGQAIQAGLPYHSPLRGEMPALADPFQGPSPGPALRYLDHVLERKSLWNGPDLLGQLLRVLVAERMLRYYLRLLPEGQAFDIVEGEWLAHRADLEFAAQAMSEALLSTQE